MNQQHMELVKRLYDEVHTKGNIAILDEICTNDLKLHDAAAPSLKRGLQGYKELETGYKIAFPTKTIKIDTIFAGDSNRIVVQWTCHGTHKGTFHDIAPTGKHVTVTGISIYQFSGDKISEIHQSWDRLGLIEQLGAAHLSTVGYH